LSGPAIGVTVRLRPDATGAAVRTCFGTVRLQPDLVALQRDPIERDEPLRRREEDDRVVAAPAVRILVRERLTVPQPAALLERRLHVRVGVEHALAAKQCHGVEEMASRPDGRVDLQPVLHPGTEIVGAVPGSRVHRARACFEGHVVAEDADRCARVQRMLKADVLELRAFHPRERRAERFPDGRTDPRRQRFGDDDGAAVHAVRRVIDLRMEGDRQIRRNRPGRRRPDQHGDVASGQCRHAARELGPAVFSEGELDVDRR